MLITRSNRLFCSIVVVAMLSAMTGCHLGKVSVPKPNLSGLAFWKKNSDSAVTPPPSQFFDSSDPEGSVEGIAVSIPKEPGDSAAAGKKPMRKPYATGDEQVAGNAKSGSTDSLSQPKSLADLKKTDLVNNIANRQVGNKSIYGSSSGSSSKESPEQ